MKRSRPPPVDTPPATRRLRLLGHDERELWDSVVRQIKPLRPLARMKASEAMLEAAAKPAPVAPSIPKPLPTRVATGPKPVSPPPTTLARRERSQLARGRKAIEARLDLHGMTQARAHNALLSFLQRASSDGLTFVLVITGKGRSADAERGVLRRQVPHWLSQGDFRAFVVGFEEAHTGHGGEGALYVRVRRSRR